MLNNIALRLLRTRILLHLDAAYPGNLDKAQLFSALNQAPNTIARELHYLADKCLITIDLPGNAKITPRGRDYLTGDVEEVGLASVSEVVM